MMSPTGPGFADLDAEFDPIVDGRRIIEWLGSIIYGGPT